MSDSQRQHNEGGSRFAILDLEDDSMYKEEMGVERRKHVGEGSTALINMAGEEANTILEKKEDCQETSKLNMVSHLDGIHKINQNVNASIIKGKNIVEKFIRTKGKEKTSTFGALKASSGGVCKPKKSRRMSC